MIRPYKLTVALTDWYYTAENGYRFWWAAGTSDKLWVPGRVQMVGASIIHSPNFPGDPPFRATVYAHDESWKTLFNIRENHVDLPLVPFTEDQLKGAWPFPPYEGATYFPIIQNYIEVRLEVRCNYPDVQPPPASITMTFALEPI